jgi:ubiquitin-protein ligase
MGFPKHLFVSAVDENLTCAICLDVLETPHMLNACGHNFCADCLSHDNLHSCPTCRQPFSLNVDTTLNRSLRSVIGNLQTCCSNNNNNNNNNTSRRDLSSSTEPPARRQRRVTDGEETTCGWIGKLSDWPHHEKTECSLTVTECKVKGCDFRCSRKQMSEHEATSIHAHVLLVQDRIQDLKIEMEDGKREIQDELAKARDQDKLHAIHLHLSKFCRNWMLHKPDPLFGFDVYIDRRHNHEYLTPKPLTSLLVGIPGPTRTALEGGLFPVLGKWHDIQSPPECYLPKDFSPLNYWPSRVIELSTLEEGYDWSSRIDIVDIIFDLQQALGHPDMDQGLYSDQPIFDRAGYDEAARWAATEYTDDSFLRLASQAFDDVTEDWILVQDKRGCSFNTQRPVDPPPPTKEHKNYLDEHNCDCSCCAWTVSYHGRDMHFLFGYLR